MKVYVYVNYYPISLFSSKASNQLGTSKDHPRVQSQQLSLELEPLIAEKELTGTREAGFGERTISLCEVDDARLPLRCRTPLQGGQRPHLSISRYAKSGPTNPGRPPITKENGAQCGINHSIINRIPIQPCQSILPNDSHPMILFLTQRKDALFAVSRVRVVV